MKRIRGRYLTLALAAAGFTAAALLARAAGQLHEQPAVPPPASAPSAVAYDSATVVVGGTLTAPVRSALSSALDAAPPVLVVLGSGDVRNCEDLGRQLRDVQALAGGPVFVATDSLGVVEVRAFARRERLRVQVIPIAPQAIVEDFPALPTPAVLVGRGDGRTAVGIAHPRRIANARVRSFAEELSSLDRTTSPWRDE